MLLPAPSRFVTVAEHDIENIIEKQSNKNTLSKTFYDMKLLKTFLSQPDINESCPIEAIPPTELCPLLSKFLLGVRKSDGSNYEPGTLRGFISSFDRRLKKQQYGYSLIQSIEFSKLREVLKFKQVELKKDGKGNLPNKSDEITDDEIELLWQKGQFGISSPQSIINTLWFYATVHFGLRGVDEHRNMCFGDMSLKFDKDGQ